MSDEFEKVVNGDLIEDNNNHLDYGVFCPRCLEEVSEFVDTGCFEKPERLKGMPIGMYHCPECGMMLLAGLEHPKICKKCFDELRVF